MAGIIKDDELDPRDETEELENESIDIDNDESFDLDGDSDEDVDTADEESDDEDEDGDISDEDDELDESDEESEETDDADTGDETAGKDDTTSKLNEQLETEKATRTRLENQARKTLKSLGIEVKEGETLEEALERVDAETEGVSLKEYRKSKREAEETQRAKELLQRQKFEELAANDLAELKKSFPDLLDKGHIKDCFNSFEDFVQFGRFRDAGIKAKEAYIAVNSDKVLTAQQKAAQQKAASDGKRHITSVAPKAANAESVVMPKETLKEWRDMFPNLTDKEIRKLYKQTI